MKILSTLFGHRLQDREWYHIILWWEARRIVYNFILLVSGLISLFIFLYILRFDGDIIHPLTPILFGIIANFFYTFGWVSELIVRQDNRKKSNSWGIKSFKVGLGIFIFLTFLPTILFSVGWAMTGDKFSSPYSHFASDKPDYKDLLGTYQLDKTKASYISDADKEFNSTIELKSDSTFIVSNYPMFSMFDNYDLCNGTGKWRIERHSSFNQAWTISVDFDSLVNLKTKKMEQRLLTNIFIYNNRPPYKLYDIVSDPDEWAGELYEKRSE